MGVMEDLESALSYIGLSITESRTYLGLLRLGPCTAYHVAKETNQYRSNCYDAINSLLEKGLVSQVISGRKKLYRTNGVSSLVGFVRDKEVKIRDVMPRLQMMEKHARTGGEATILQGIPSVMNICYSLLRYQKTISVYGIPKIVPLAMKAYLNDFHYERIRRKIQMNHIYNYDAVERIKFLNSLPCTTAKYLPESVKSNAATLICGPEVMITVWPNELSSANKVKAIHIVDEEIAESYLNYFNFLMKKAK